MNENVLAIAGNLCWDPQPRYAANGQLFCTFRIASTVRYLARDGSGYKDGHTSYFDVIAWRGLAQNCVASLKIGQPVLVKGRLRVSQFTRKDDSDWVSAEIDAEAIGHNLALGSTTYQKGFRPYADPDDRANDPEVVRVRADGWQGPRHAVASPSTPAPARSATSRTGGGHHRISPPRPWTPASATARTARPKRWIGRPAS